MVSLEYSYIYIYLCVLISVDIAAEWAHAAIMANHGQNCCAASRTFVQQGIYDTFVAKSKEAAINRIVGNPWDDITMQGPQVRVMLP